MIKEVRRYRNDGLPPMPSELKMAELLKIYTYKEIAVMYERKPQTINDFCSKNGIKRKSKPSRKEIELLTQRMTTREAAMHYSETEKKVQSWAYQHSVSWLRTKGNHNCKLGLKRELVEELVGFYMYGMRMCTRRTAEVLDMPMRSVRYVKTILDQEDR